LIDQASAERNIVAFVKAGMLVDARDSIGLTEQGQAFFGRIFGKV
jgi:hypothetical protein